MRLEIKPITVWDDSTESTKEVYGVTEVCTSFVERLFLFGGGFTRTFGTKEGAERYAAFVRSRSDA